MAKGKIVLYVKLVVGNLLLLEFGDYEQGNMCLPLFMWVCTLKYIHILQMEKYLYSSWFSSLQLLENLGWKQNTSRIWIVCKWSLEVELCLVTPCCTVSCANSSGSHLPLSGTNFSSQDVELTLTLHLLPIPPQQSSLPGSRGRTKGLLEDELHISQVAEGLILRALGQTFYSPGPQTYFLP